MSSNELIGVNRRRLLAGLASGGVATTASMFGGTSKSGATAATDTGSVAWKQPGNNHHVLELQAGNAGAPEGEVSMEYWGHCAFKITSPLGFTMLFDPWRNDPSGYWGVWFPNDFSNPAVDAGFSTHTHFDHDAIDHIQPVAPTLTWVGYVVYPAGVSGNGVAALPGDAFVASNFMSTNDPKAADKLMAGQPEGGMLIAPMMDGEVRDNELEAGDSLRFARLRRSSFQGTGHCSGECGIESISRRV